MKNAPHMNANSFVHFFMLTLNSSTTTSLAAIYKNVPPANELNMMFIKAPPPDIDIPMSTPTGVATENAPIS